MAAWQSLGHLDEICKNQVVEYYWDLDLNFSAETEMKHYTILDAWEVCRRYHHYKSLAELTR